MKRIDPGAFRRSLLQLLEAPPAAGEDQFLARFERLRAEGQPVYSQVLYILTHLSFAEPEARRHWQKILAHRARCQGRLGRDPGLRVSILDNFVNVNSAFKSPKVIELATYERTERSAVTDGLTGLFNHTYFLQALQRELQRGRRHNYQLSLILFDLDNFKKLNDTLGHLEGDRVLVKSAALVRETLREMDVAARYGGEEFAVVLPDTPRTGGYVVAERIRHRVEAHFRRTRRTPDVTISGGVATCPDDAGTIEELIQRADEGLYRSKAAGKNRITLVAGERRRHLRVPVRHKVTVADASRRKIAARAKNASEGGLLVSVDRPISVGSSVELMIHPSRGATRGVRGEVVRVEASPASHELFDIGLRLHGDPSRTPVLLKRPGRA